MTTTPNLTSIADEVHALEGETEEYTPIAAARIQAKIAYARLLIEVLQLSKSHVQPETAKVTTDAGQARQAARNDIRGQLLQLVGEEFWA